MNMLANDGNNPPTAIEVDGLDDFHVVRCHRCDVEFDATSASWCHCIASEHTVVCPGCGTCFCKGTTAYKRDFWRDAPKTLRERSVKGPDARTEHASEEQPTTSGARGMVLLVEDDPVTRRAAMVAIRGLGYPLMVATDGEQGLELARRLQPAVVLTDALMPKIDGREMCRQIKEDPACVGVRVFVMTALYTGVKYQNEAHKHFKVDGYLAKPVAIDELAALLEKELEPAVY
jgi:CheY-like chemotaxis protein